ncbi:MAG: hypothetical protein AAF228_13650, partial [Pseudomonadota bacterium]
RQLLDGTDVALLPSAAGALTAAAGTVAGIMEGASLAAAAGVALPVAAAVTAVLTPILWTYYGPDIKDQLFSQLTSDQKGTVETTSEDPYALHAEGQTYAASLAAEQMTPQDFAKQVTAKLKFTDETDPVLRQTADIFKGMSDEVRADRFRWLVEEDLADDGSLSVTANLVLYYSLDVDNGPLVTPLLDSLSATILGQIFKEIKTKVNTHTCYHYPGLLYALKNLPPPLAAAGLVFLNDPEFGAYLLECLHEITGSRVLDAMVRLDIKPKLDTTNRAMAAKIWSELEFIERSDDTDANPNLGNKSGIVLYMTYEAAVGMLLAKENGSNINYDPEIMDTFNALVDDETVVNPLEYVVTPLLGETYKGGDTRGQGIVNTYLKDYVGDDELYLVSQGDPEDDLLPAIIDRIIAGDQTSTGGGRMLAENIPQDFGIIEDDVALNQGLYDKTLAIRNTKSTSEAYGTIYDGNVIAVVPVRETNQFNGGFRAIRQFRVNGKSYSIVVKPQGIDNQSDVYEPLIHTNDSGQKYVMALSSRKEPTDGSRLYYGHQVLLDEIEGKNETKYDITPRYNGIYPIPEGHTFESYVNFRHLDQFAKLDIPETTFQIPKNPQGGPRKKVDARSLLSLNAKPQKSIIDNTAPTPLVQIRTILKNIKKNGGIDKATNQQVANLYYLVANLGWKDPGLSSEIRIDEQALILGLFFLNKRSNDAKARDILKDFDPAVLHYLSTVNKHSASLPSGTQQQVDAMIAKTKNAILDYPGLMSAIDNWENLLRPERHLAIDKLFEIIRINYGMGDAAMTLTVTSHPGEFGKYYLNPSNEPENTYLAPEIKIDSDFLEAASFPEVIDVLGREFFKIWSERKDGAVPKDTFLLFSAGDVHTQKTNEEQKTKLYYELAVNRAAIEVGGYFGTYFSQRADQYYRFNDTTWQTLYGAPLLTSKVYSKPMLGPESSTYDPMKLSGQLFSSDGQFTARFFVHPKRNEIHFGTMTHPFKDTSKSNEDTSKPGKVIWSKKVYDLSDELIKIDDISLKFDDRGYLVAAFNNGSLKGQTVDIFEYTKENQDILGQADTNALKTNRLKVTDSGTLRQSMSLKNTNGQLQNKLIFETENSYKKPPESLEVRLELGKEMNATQFLTSDNGLYQMHMEWKDDNQGGAVHYRISKSENSEQTVVYDFPLINPDENYGSFGKLSFEEGGLYHVNSDYNKTPIVAIPENTVPKGEGAYLDSLSLNNDGSLSIMIFFPEDQSSQTVTIFAPSG